MELMNNPTRALKGLKVTEDRVICLNKSFIELERDFYDSIADKSINHVTMLSVFVLNVQDDDDENVYNSLSIDITFILPISFNTMEIKSDKVILHIEPNNEVLSENFYKNDVNVAYQYFVKLISGKLNDQPKMNYVNLLESVKSVLTENEIKGHSSLEYELLFQGLCRDVADGQTPFRVVTNKNNPPAKDFIMVNIRDIPRLESPFNAISSENIQQGLLKTLNKDSNSTILSPLEKIALSKQGQ